MSRFEFLSVLVSIIVALALTELIAGWGRMLRNRTRAAPHWLHVFWMILLFIVLTEVWWSLWELREITEWTYIHLLIILTGPTIGALAVEVITPNEVSLDEHPQSLRTHYFEAAPVFFTLLAIAEAALIGKNLCFFGFRPWIMPLQALGFLLLLVLAVSRNSRLHKRLSVALFCVFVVVAAVRFRL